MHPYTFKHDAKEYMYIEENSVINFLIKTCCHPSINHSLQEGSN